MKSGILFFIIGYIVIIYNVSAQNNPPIAQNDTIEAFPGYPVSINVLQNDYDPDGDSIFLVNGYPLEDSIYYFNSDYHDYFLFNGIKRFTYIISDDTTSWSNSWDGGFVYVIINNPYYDSLHINNVNARFSCFGSHFRDFQDPGGAARYFVPNGSKTSSIFYNNIWFGGQDITDSLHIARSRYSDYRPGPISNTYDSVYDVKWSRIWKISRTDLDYHNSHWWEAGYEPIEAIASWPGNGDVANGQMEQIAPFTDNNNDGIYNPFDGDSPIIKGDQTLFFVFNDKRRDQTKSIGRSFGIEIHAMAYAFNAPQDSALWNTTFLSYEIFNHSDTTYYDTYIGSYTDIDLGYPYDDYIGSNVQGGYYYCYNGDNYDENYYDTVTIGYGNNPPAQAVMILGGPFMDEDGIDNPKFDTLGQQLCNESINGLNFGDTIIDNERLGMSSFLNCSWSPDYIGYPSTSTEVYNYLRGILLDGTTCLYGGNGHLSTGAVGPECKFIYPGDSDTCNWGTNGIPPNGGYNQPGLYWTDPEAGNNPWDRKALASSGPFTFEPGDVQKLDLAFVWARAYDGDPWSSALLLKERCSFIKNKFENDYEFFSDINIKSTNQNNLTSYPNPVTDKLTLKFPFEIRKGSITIYSMQGNIVYSQAINNQTEEKIVASFLNKGLYVIKVTNENAVYTIKFMKD